MQIKTTMRYHFTLVRMGIFRKTINSKCWRQCGEKGTLLQCCVLSRFSRVWLFMTYGPQPTRLFSPWDSPVKNTGVGCHALLQGIFLTQGSNLHLLHCRWILYFWATGEAPYTVGGNVNWYSHNGELYGDSLKTKSRATIWPCNPTPGHISGGKHLKGHTHPVFTAALFIIAKA